MFFRLINNVLFYISFFIEICLNFSNPQKGECYIIWANLSKYTIYKYKYIIYIAYKYIIFLCVYIYIYIYIYIYKNFVLANTFCNLIIIII